MRHMRQSVTTTYNKHFIDTGPEHGVNLILNTAIKFTDLCNKTGFYYRLNVYTMGGEK